MLINCPHCGPRDQGEFTYQGDATLRRPDHGSTDVAAWNAFVYDRTNPAGDHTECWQHSGGCRSHLVVVRDTVSHQIKSVAFARASASKTTRRKKAARP